MPETYKRLSPIEGNPQFATPQSFLVTNKRLNKAAEFTKLCTRENEILRMAAKICHEMYMAGEFGDLPSNGTADKKDWMNF